MTANSSLQFVDTNILIYAHDSTAGAKFRRSRQLVNDLWQTGTGCLSVQVLQEFYVNVTRVGGMQMNPASAAQIVHILSSWHVHAPDAGDVSEAIAIHQRFGISFWDALIIRSAAHFGCGVLLTEDLNHGQDYDGVRAHNPFA